MNSNNMFTDILKTKFLTIFRTGNNTMDMIISAIIFSFVTRMASYRKKIYQYIVKLLRNYVFSKRNFLKYYAIEHIKESCIGNLIERKLYPTTILSLIYYVIIIVKRKSKGVLVQKLMKDFQQVLIQKKMKKQLIVLTNVTEIVGMILTLIL